MVKLNYAEIRRRGAAICSNADLSIVVCNKCAAQFLYDAESLTLWPDPAYLRRTILNVGPVGAWPPLKATIEVLGPCPRCNAADWDFTSCDSESEVAGGPWGWALRKP